MKQPTGAIHKWTATLLGLALSASAIGGGSGLNALAPPPGTPAATTAPLAPMPPAAPAPGRGRAAPPAATPPAPPDLDAPPPDDRNGRDGLPADVEREARNVAAGREPAVLEHGDDVQVPYGHGVPVVRCAPLRVCLIELEDGELVLNTVTGDSARWLLDRALAGPRAATTVIVAKPTACNLTTNLVVTTNRRIYQITLDAPPCRERGGNPRQPFTRRLRFYYPDDLVRTWASAEQARRAAAAAETQALTPLAAPVPLGSLHFGYRWTRNRRYPWAPVAVFDDGAHTYIRLPGSGVGQDSPLLFLIDGKGATALLNYAIRGQYYVTDRVIDRAALVLGSGRDQQRLEITREH
jgi:P-type conjugative transfer protein TrbG